MAKDRQQKCPALMGQNWQGCTPPWSCRRWSARMHRHLSRGIICYFHLDRRRRLCARWLGFHHIGGLGTERSPRVVSSRNSPVIRSMYCTGASKPALFGRVPTPLAVVATLLFGTVVVELFVATPSSCVDICFGLGSGGCCCCPTCSPSCWLPCRKWLKTR